MGRTTVPLRRANCTGPLSNERHRTRYTRAVLRDTIMLNGTYSAIVICNSHAEIRSESSSPSYYKDSDRIPLARDSGSLPD